MKIDLYLKYSHGKIHSICTDPEKSIWRGEGMTNGKKNTIKSGRLCLLVEASADIRQELLMKVEKALRGGLKMILLRKGSGGEEDMEGLSAGLTELAERYAARLFIEGSPETAEKVGAAGLYLDPEKMEDLPENDPPADSLLYKGGPVRSPEQAVRAEAVGADYLSAGPVSAGGSGSPVNETDLISPGELRKICEAVKIPVFAETSLRAADVPALSGSGIAGILTPAPLSAGGITEETARLSDAVHQLQGAAGIRAAVFDYDGTILDSMPMWGTTPARFAARLGREVDDSFNDSIKYMSLEESAQIFREFGAKGTDEEIVDQIMDMVFESYRDELQLKEGVVELLEDLSAHGIRMSIATQTPSKMILAANKRLGIDHYFEAVYSCGEWKTHKKEPDIYYIAAAGIGAAPCETLVFEDMVYAAETAGRAGFTVMGVADDSSVKDRERIRKASRLFLESLKEWPGIGNLEKE